MMNPANTTLIKDIVWSIRKLVRAVYYDSQKMSRQFGLTGPQSVVLRFLLKNGPMSAADLSRLMFVTPSNMTGIIDRLEKKGLAERTRKVGDRRIALITLTDTGKELGGRLPDPLEQKVIKQLSGLDHNHVQTIAGAMKQILDLVDFGDFEDTPWEISQESMATVQDTRQKSGAPMHSQSQLEEGKNE
jgi:DNA-binding MarR family transcriptional regulator